MVFAFVQTVRPSVCVSVQLPLLVAVNQDRSTHGRERATANHVSLVEKTKELNRHSLAPGKYLTVCFSRLPSIRNLRVVFYAEQRLWNIKSDLISS